MQGVRLQYFFIVTSFLENCSDTLYDVSVEQSVQLLYSMENSNNPNSCGTTKIELLFYTEGAKSKVK